MFSTGVDGLNRLLNNGYPEKSAILVVGPPGIGKEALGYWFAQDGLSRGDFCLYVTRLTVSEVLDDTRAFGVESLKTWGLLPDPEYFHFSFRRSKMEIEKYARQ